MTNGEAHDPMENDNAALDALLDDAQDELLLTISARAVHHPDISDARLDAQLQAAQDELLEAIREQLGTKPVAPKAAEPFGPVAVDLLRRS